MRSPNSAILKVTACSICGSDLHMYHGAHIGSTDYSRGAARFCCGHEFIGEVVETGPDVHRFRSGQKVLAAMQDGVLNLCRVKLRDQQRLAHEIGGIGLEVRVQPRLAPACALA